MVIVQEILDAAKDLKDAFLRMCAAIAALLTNIRTPAAPPSAAA